MKARKNQAKFDQMTKLHDEGNTEAAIGKMFGLSRQRIHQILNPGKIVFPFRHKCALCSYDWNSRKENPLRCPHCETHLWTGRAPGSRKREPEAIHSQYIPLVMTMGDKVLLDSALAITGENRSTFIRKAIAERAEFLILAETLAL